MPILRRTVRLLRYDGNEYAVTLDKRTSLRIGNCYRLYFRQDTAHDQGTSFLDGYLDRDRFLGLEDLGEYHAENIEADTKPQD